MEIYLISARYSICISMKIWKGTVRFPYAPLQKRRTQGQRPLRPDTLSQPFPSACSTLSGVAGGSTHTPMALWMAMTTRWVLARLWEMPLAP